MQVFRRTTKLPLKAALIFIIGLTSLSVSRDSRAQSHGQTAASLRKLALMTPPAPPQAEQSAPTSTPPQPAPVVAPREPVTASGACVLDPKLPLSCKTIMIDPGHGGFQAGAVRGKVEEKNITLSVALKLRDLLKADGATVIMTRTTDVALSLHDRAVMSNTLKPDIFLSIHVNANTDRAIHGVETYYYTNESSVLSQDLFNSLSATLHEQANWSRWDDLFVLDWNTRVASLAEIGYLSHANSFKNLTQDAYQQKVAQALCTGIENYFKAVPLAPPPAVLAVPVPMNSGPRSSHLPHVHEADVL